MVRRIRYLTLDDVLVIIEELRRTYPKDFIRVMNVGALEAALDTAAYAGYGLRQFRARVAAVAASLLSLIVLNHALTDGNKRLAYLVTKAFLEANGYRVSGALLRNLTIRVASLSIDVKGVYKVLYNNIVKVR